MMTTTSSTSTYSATSSTSTSATTSINTSASASTSTVGSSTLLPQTGWGYGFHLNTSAPVTTHALLQQINKLSKT